MTVRVLQPRRPWEGRRVVLGVTGGIAAYKSVQVARDLTRLGARVDVVMTPGPSTSSNPSPSRGSRVGRSSPTSSRDRDRRPTSGWEWRPTSWSSHRPRPISWPGRPRGWPTTFWPPLFW